MWQEETMKGQSKEAILLRAEAAANPTHTFEECMDYYTNYSHYYDDVSKYSSLNCTITCMYFVQVKIGECFQNIYCDRYMERLKLTKKYAIQSFMKYCDQLGVTKYRSI